MNNLEDVRQWKDYYITKMIMRKLEQRFDAHEQLLGAETGTSVDLLKGQRQVMEVLRNVEGLFDGEEE